MCWMPYSLTRLCYYTMLIIIRFATLVSDSNICPREKNYANTLTISIESLEDVFVVLTDNPNSKTVFELLLKLGANLP